MASGADADVRVSRHVVPQGDNELIEKARDPELDFRCRRRWNRPQRHLLAAASDDLFAVFGDELMKHGCATPFSTQGTPRQ